MNSRNQFRSKSFIKIKHTIHSCTDAGHLVAARQMLDNSIPILSRDELIILREYLLVKWDEINSVIDSGSNYWIAYFRILADQMDSIQRERLSAQ